LSRSLLINADDFGWTDGHNQAVERAYQRGVLRRVSLLSNGDAFDEAVDLTRRLPDLRVGVHLTLNEGRPLTAPDLLPRLTDPSGVFYDEVSDLARLWLSGHLRVEEAMAEWRAQIERPLQVGLALNHLDTHKHVHMFPPLLEAVVRLAQEYQVNNIRLPLEAWNIDSLRRGPQGLILWSLALRARTSLRAAGLHFADHFMGISLSGAMVGERLRRAVATARPGVTEIMVHPAVITPAVAALQRRYRWAARYRFAEELEAVCSLQL
jgi:hopanoid biosynthesis associated protein HpnK